LISYQPKVGGSHFTVALAANLFLRGSKILMLTAYPMAKDDFLEQVGSSKIKVAYVTNANQLNSGSPVIIFESGNERLFHQALEGLTDIDERVMLIKNFELFSEEAISACLALKKVIVSGDVDKCLAPDRILAKRFQTYIVFSQPKAGIPFAVPELKKYSGYLWSQQRKGLVSLRMGT
jgi:hypothetical protein